ncbi:MAG: hypothetical protein H5T86_09340 [Armatimonadetes bacterium]|nr:hypothetical protein [Armatimonadota bacterium]
MPKCDLCGSRHASQKANGMNLCRLCYWRVTGRLPEPSTRPAPSWSPSVRQLRRLWALARAAGLDYAAVQAEIMRRYGVDSVKKLSRAAYQGFTRSLEMRARRLKRRTA